MKYFYSATKNVITKLVIFIGVIALTACNTESNNQSAYLNVSVKSAVPQSKSNRDIPSYAQDTGSVNILPDGITQVKFTITDSNGAQSTTSLPVGPQTETINIRVSPHRDLIIVIEALTGNTVSFMGETNISALRPGQIFPLSLSLDEVGAPTPPPTDTPVILNISQAASKFEGDNGLSDLVFNVSLSALANGNVNVDYTTSAGTAIGEFDFGPTVGTLTIPAGELSATISVPIIGDTSQEPDENFTLTLSNASANTRLNNAIATGFIISDDFPGRLNDTGVVLCGDYSLSLTNVNSNTTNNNSDICNSSQISQTVMGYDLDDDPVPAGQDALYGRDASENDNTDGTAGFNFTKLDANGSPLTDQTQDYATQPWACVKDNYTGLTWEVKTNSGLQDKTSRYSWLNTTGINDGGDPGVVGDSTGCVSNIGCNTEAYVIDMNAVPVCGANNWRMPTVTELLSIVNNSRIAPAIDINFFPNTWFNTSYWTSSSQAFSNSTSFYAWSIDFAYGTVETRWKQSTINSIRLVHDDVLEQ